MSKQQEPGRLPGNRRHLDSSTIGSRMMWWALALAWMSVQQGGCGTSGGLREDLVFSGDLAVQEETLGTELVEAPNDPDLNLRMAALLRQRGRYAEARSHAERALAQRPNDAVGLHLLGLIELDRGDSRAAAQHLLACTDADAAYAPRARADLQRSLRAGIDDAVAAGEASNVIGLADELESRFGASEGGDRARVAAVVLARAAVLFDGGYYREALGAVERAERHEITKESRFRRATLLSQLGEAGSDEAFAAYVAALPDAEKAEGWRSVARHYAGAFDFERAAAAYARAATYAADAPGLDMEVGLLALKMRRFDDAKVHFDRHLSLLAPVEREGAILELVKDLVRFQARELAESYLTSAIDAAPGSAAPVRALSRLHQRAGDGRAVDVIRAFASRNPTEGARLEAARAAEELGLLDLAFELHTARLAGPPPAPQAWLDIARVEHARGRLAQRDQALRDYVDGQGSSVVARRAAGVTCAELGAVSCAESWLVPLAASHPEELEAIVALAEIRLGQGKTDAALALAESHLNAPQATCEAWLTMAEKLERGLPAEIRLLWLEKAGNCPDSEIASRALLALGFGYLSGNATDVSRAEAAFRAHLQRASDKAVARRTVIDALAGRRGFEGLRAELLLVEAEVASASSDAWLAAAEALVAAQKYHEAVQASARFVQLSPGDHSAAVASAIQLIARPASRRYLPELLALVDTRDIDDPRVHYELGMLFASEPRDLDLARAQWHFERYLATTPEPGAKLGNVAELWLDRGFADLAVKGLRKAIADGGEVAALAERLGRAHLALGQVAHAEAAFRMALDGASSESGTVRSIAAVWTAAGYPDRAAALLAQIAESGRKSERDEAFSAWLAALGAVGDRAGIERAAQVYTAAASQRQRALELAAEELTSRGLWKEAEVYYQAIEDQGRERAEVLLAHARVAMAQGALDRAVALIRRAAGMRAYSAQAVLGLAGDLELSAHWQEAKELYDESVMRGNENSALLVRRALVALRLGDADAAHQDGSKAIAMDGGPALVVGELVPAMQRAWRLDLALDLAQRAAAAAPERRDVRIAAIQLLLAVGRLEEAQTATRAFLQDDPSAGDELAPLWEEHMQYEEAIRLLESALVSAEGLEGRDAIVRLTRLLSAVGRAAEVAPLVEQYVRGSQDRPARVEDAIDAALSAGEFELAATLFRSLEADVPGPAIPYRVGLMRFAEGRDDEAVREMRRAVDALGNWREQPGNRGSLAQAAADASQAIESVARSGRVADAVRLSELAIGHIEDAPSALSTDLAYGGSLDAFRDAWLEGTLSLGEVPEAIQTIVTAWGRGQHGAASTVSVFITRFAGASAERELRASVDAAAAGEQVRSPLLLAATLLAARAGDGEAYANVLSRYLAHIPAAQHGDRVELATALLGQGAAKAALDLVLPLTEPRFGSVAADAVEVATRASIALGDRGKAQRVLRRFLEDSPGKVFALQTVAWVAEMVQEWDAAASALSALAPLLPPSDGVSVALLEQRTSARSAEARAFLSGRGVTLQALARVEWFRGRPGDAVRALRDMLAQSRDWVAASAVAVDQLATSFADAEAFAVAADWAAREPGNLQLRLRLMELALESGGVDAATEQVRALLEAASPSGHYALMLAEKWLDAGHIEGAQRLMAKVEGAPAWKVHFVESLLRAREGRYDEALKSAESFAGLHPAEWPWAVELLARQPFSDSTIPSSHGARLAARVLEARPDAFASGAIRAIAQLTAGDSQPAKAWVGRASGYFVDEYLGEIAFGAIRSGDFALATSALDRLGRSSESLRRGWETAFDVVRRSLSATPKADDAWRSALRGLGLRYLEGPMKAEPADAWVATLLSDLLESTGDPTGAEQVYDSLLTRLPGDSTVRNNLAYLYARRGEKLDRAAALVEQAQRLDPTHNIYYLDTAGWVAFRQGDLQRAQELVEASVRLMSTRQGASAAEGFWHLGQVFDARGQQSAATRAYRRAARLDRRGEYGDRAREALSRTTAPNSMP